MALFGSKKTNEKKTAKVAKPARASRAASALSAVDTEVIRRPRLTEKAAVLSSQNVFTFDVALGASKHDVARAITALYKVIPLKVNIVNSAGKPMPLRTRRGTGVRNRVRKAYVYLKKGDTIDFAA